MGDWWAALAGAVIGAAIALGVWLLFARREQRLLATLVEEAAQARTAELGAIVEQLRGQFATLSREALTANAEDFLTLAKTRLDQATTTQAETLEGKKRLIDAQLEAIGKRLTELGQSMQTQESARRESHGAIRAQLEQTTQTAQQLQVTTEQLRQALANPQRRGQWGERIAEDVLRLAGFVEGVSYFKQVAGDGKRPDYTFPLPNDQVVNMDVKFPLANYMRVLDAEEEERREALTREFLRDVRNRVREVTTRDYIDPAAGTVDYVLIFIPNEQIYGFIHQHDPGLLDDALRSRVVLCSPLTLYAMLAVMRQAAQNVRLQQASFEILRLFGDFRKQWDKYGDVVEKLGRQLNAALGAYQDLTTTRTRQLERALDKIEALREARESESGEPRLPAGDDDDE